MPGGVKQEQLASPDPDAVRRGVESRKRHIHIVRRFGLPAVVALNRFVTDTDEEFAIVRDAAAAQGVEALRCDVWEKGGKGGLAVAEAVLGLLERDSSWPSRVTS